MPADPKPAPRRQERPDNPNPPSFTERMRGKRSGDIHLPSRKGERDPKLDDPIEGLKQALRHVRRHVLK